MKKIKYVIKTRDQILKQRILAYSVIIVILGLLSFLCVKSFKKVEATETIAEEKKIEPEVKTNKKGCFYILLRV